MILTRDRNRSKVKLQKIDLGRNQSIIVDGNRTKMNDVTVASLESSSYISTPGTLNAGTTSLGDVDCSSLFIHTGTLSAGASTLGALICSSVSTPGTLNAATSTLGTLTCSSVSTPGTLNAGASTLGALICSSVSTPGTLNATTSTLGALNCSSISTPGTLNAATSTLGALNCSSISSGVIAGTTLTGSTAVSGASVTASSGNISTLNGKVLIKGLAIEAPTSTELSINRLEIGDTLFTNTITGNTSNFVIIEDSSGVARLQLDAGGGNYGIRYMASGTGSGNYIRFRYNNASHLYVYSNGTEVLDLISNGSDDRIKSNEISIVPQAGLEIVNKLRPELYDKRNNMNEEQTSENTIRESGFIAQQIWYEIPELRHCVNIAEDAEPVEGVTINHDNPEEDLDYTALGWGSTAASLNYNMFLPYLVASIQKLSAEVDLLKSRN